MNRFYMTKPFKFFLLLSSFTLVFVIARESVSGTSYAFSSTQVTSANIVQRGGVIRLSPKGVYLHVNSTHHSVGIKSVKINNSGNLEIATESVAPIISINVSPDETLAQRGVIAGASVGNQTTIIKFSKNGKALNLKRSSDYNLIASDVSNIWVSWLSHQ
ncbi:hypothetical protein [Bacillus sp. AFS041924]|uniref:hypothetical protein n=1 Tax=Bacillus sp. AFS041924 TaxID=2033503 RepID=UPI000BFDDA46|nr:hypothetical protein [Bacillus sp. AFS041924]PGS48700.1 hypothetical protein COC46_17000 [Bacillus sp. AFS041924]